MSLSSPALARGGFAAAQPVATSGAVSLAAHVPAACAAHCIRLRPPASSKAVPICTARVVSSKRVLVVKDLTLSSSGLAFGQPLMPNVRPQMRAWHDYHITSYTVDGKNREIRFDISWPYETATDIERAVVVFSGVEGYFFENDLGGNIVYAFSEESLEEFLAEHRPQFEESAKWGWPLFWVGSVSQSLEGLRNNEVKCFELSSSYGLSGWLLARSVEHHDPEA